MNRIYAGIGNRTTPNSILEKMVKISSELAKDGWVLRSGGAKGADTAFETGCDMANGKKEIFRPNELYLLPKETVEKASILAQKYHGDKRDELGNQIPSPNIWNNLSEHAQLCLTRNAMIILGENCDHPVDLVICYQNIKNKYGGTRHGMNMARAYKVPYIINLYDEINIDLLLKKFKKKEISYLE